MFKHLASSKNHTVSISMRNSFGKGPAATITVETPSETIGKKTSILAGVEINGRFLQLKWV